MSQQDAIAERPEGREPLQTYPTGQGATDPRCGDGARNADGAAAYWRRRERTARTLAARAVDQHIARIHLDMAERYAVLADGASRTQPPE